MKRRVAERDLCLFRGCCAVVWLFVGGVFAADEAAAPFGLSARVPWTTGRVTGSPDPPAPYRLERAWPKLQFTNPVELTSAPGSDRLFVVEVAGKLVSFRNDPACEQTDLFFDLKAENPQVEHVYGLAFHPQFAENRLCYICYTWGQNIPDGTRVSRFRVSTTEPPLVDPASEEIILTWLSGGHNGGSLKFGSDGYLYISTGDGGPAFPPDPLQSGQDVSNLLSSILRIDVDRPDDSRRYSIPPDNPFVDTEGARGEIWCYGLRNPWRMSFDSETGDLWVGDVGWELWELVYRVERGANYGWSLMEGPQPVHGERPRGPTPIVAPTAAHSHIEARSITGGFVYRGDRLAALQGQYIYGDYVTGKMWALSAHGEQPPAPRELVDTALQIICFGEDNQGELYVVGYDGTLHRLVANNAAAVNDQFPTRLSETGLFADTAEHRVAPGVIPYGIIAEPWMDGATAQRYVAIPGASSLTVEPTNDLQSGRIKGAWRFPADSVLLKTISLALDSGNPDSRRRLESQLLHFDGDNWRAYDYIWNDEQTDALLAPNQASERSFEVLDAQAPGGKRQQTWHFASRTECLLCHSTRGGSIYGFVPSQLDRQFDYGGRADNQLRTLHHIGLFANAATDANGVLVDPHDPAADLEPRARAYLHVNCAHCHRRGGGGTAAIDIPYPIPLAKTNLLDARPTQGTFGLHGAAVVASGDPQRSVLLYRMAKLGRGRMPYVGSSVVDEFGLQLLTAWIASLEAPVEPNNAPAISFATSIQELRESPHENVRRNAATSLLSSTTGAMWALQAVDAGRLPSQSRDELLTLATRHADIQVRDLFERFLPAEQRTQRLGSTIQPDEILRLTGDVERGRTLYFSTDGLQCRNCHQVRGQGKAVGPELSEIGKKLMPAQLLQSILEPSAAIDPKFVTHLVETKDGRVFTGVLLERNTAGLTLKDAQANEVHIAQADIEFNAPQQRSLMPELQLQDLTAQQVADLVAFLAAQR